MAAHSAPPSQYYSPADDHNPKLPGVGQTRCSREVIPIPRLAPISPEPTQTPTHPPCIPGAPIAYMSALYTYRTIAHWALLSATLQFIYLDPVLAYHLGSEAHELVGKSLITFVHPDEQSSAQQDLGSVLESRTLHGSVTRVRFSRLSRVRRELGYLGPGPSWSDGDKIALDNNYMAVDIVINWAAEGVVLCFIHAIVDLTPKDNDEAQKTGWTNWCGTPSMDQEQVELLFRRLLVCIPQLSNMNRVFQILSNEQRSLLISWPPDPDQGPAGRDFAKLVEDVQIGPGAPTGNEAKTSCTRRYKALQTMPAVAGEVESIFIPHGSVIFACHKVNSPSRSTATTPTNMQQIAYNAPSYTGQTPYYESPGLSYPSSAPSAPYNYLSQSAQSSPSIPAPYSPRWSQPQGEQQPPSTYGGQWPSSSHQGHTTSNLRSGSYPPPQGQQWPSQPPSYNETPNPNGPTFQRPLSPTYGYGSPPDENTSPGTDVVPPPRRRVSPGSTRESAGPGRGGNRPTGVLKCSSCKATTSPEWRKGPSGKKELCNACGLRYARSRAKKEGTQAQRKRKEKGAVVKRGASATPPSSSGSYSAIRRNYDDGSFSSAGSGSGGSDVYPRLDSTPSPSPPASNMNFVHYSPSDTHPHYPASGSASFYSVPSPLSNPPVQSSGNQSYTDQASPMHSPAAHSPLTAPSFERERERDLLPPPPISAEPRHMRRSILQQ
ncbi:hypothetical protein B0H15DRAFT_942207 [Mycena belliarum]|uniref:GATA-type domain-containing protein n=1 Tax=Mycena belliarum TaxID=1033014 RepID=A0AAD6Y290_9AGAR|nr:hypothetical protein B0H15DRAFT_942207 [Mycena belliae]